MFKFRTLTICLKFRVVVIISWVTSCTVIQSPPRFFTNLHCGSGSFQFPALLTRFRPSRNRVLTWNEKESTQRTKAAPGLFFLCIKIIKSSTTATCSPPNIYFQTLLPSEVKKKKKSYRIQYITFCFTSLELQNGGQGWVGSRNNLPSLHWIWLSVHPQRNQKEQLNCIFFFFFLFW